ncbi:hypothetical protein QE109_07750 [Fusibacter bizertensis]|uniref:Uncharacterized protein n=1 Tax=Fusibacter bizertensis TaxID=1488331 RepID=A0ABT6NC86_9FIRM|nr:hypothetical protein [Fusibacter bizertensis]MDH8678037.1 hypothetical protein [Fusibacter bizertensis]
MDRNRKTKHNLHQVIKIFLFVVIIGTVLLSLYFQSAKTEKSAEKTAHKFLVALYDATPKTLNNILPIQDASAASQDEAFKLYIKNLNQAIRKRFGNCYTDEFWNYMIGNRMWLTAPIAAQNRECDIKVKAVTFKRLNPKEKEVHLNFEVEMAMTSCNNHVVKPVIQSGEMWLVFEGYNYKVSQLIYIDNQLIQYTY